MTERITSGLRTWTSDHFGVGDWRYESIMKLADRIDSAHAHGMEERADRYSELRAKMNNCYVELPKDADGEYIHIGDRMENNERVARIVLTDDSWEPSVYLEKLPNVLHEYFCNEISHYHTPTVEDVLREMLEKLNEVNALYVGEAIDSDERERDVERVFAEYAAKLQLRGDAE